MSTRAFSALLCGLAIAFALATSAAPGEAAANLNSSKSNVYLPIGSNADADACLKAGGAVVMKEGKRVCEISAAAAINLNSSRSN